MLGFARTFFVGGAYRPEPFPTLDAEVARFHEMLEDLGTHLERGSQLLNGMTSERLLQGPFADVAAQRLGPDQPAPASPDAVWPEAPRGWTRGRNE